ncbi:unnamed protein product [Dibothriocephalus latus]|uniref:B9 domain-containing protein 1 n=1 Tax=Dibothriocephalus latus TaxID=60516 RepID=A0A3P7P9M5_DIBLA|nr:unnamed protein product [Dibothriocephalus latus]
MTTEELKAEYFLVNFPAFDNIWCKYCFSYGRDWTIVAGIDEGITQTSVKSSSDEHDLILNFPIEISWRSTNPSGWPQIAVHAYGVDALGKDVVRGYGAVHVPMQPGRHRRRIAMFTPESSSQLMALNAWFTGKRPEFVSPKVVTTGEGREGKHTLYTLINR